MKLRKNLYYIVGAFLITSAIVLKSTLNHNFEVWLTVKNTTLILLVLGVTSIFVNIWGMVDSKNKSFRKLPFKEIIIKFINGLLIILMFLLVLGLENFSEFLNYKIRDYYLSKNTIETQGTINEYFRYYLPHMEDEDFYLVSFKVNDKTVDKGVLVDYCELDGQRNFEKIIFNENTLSVQSGIGSNVKIVYSKSFPSFFKIQN